MLPSDKEYITKFADEFITCSLKNVRTEDIVREVQMHFHTKSCLKHGPNCPCRFFYPRLPSLRTVVSVPFNKGGGSPEENIDKLEKSKKLLKQVSEILEDDNIMKELAEVGKQEIFKYKSLQRKILSIRNVIEIQKDKKEKTTIISDENCQNIIRECIDNEPNRP